MNFINFSLFNFVVGGACFSPGRLFAPAWQTALGFRSRSPQSNRGGGTLPARPANALLKTRLATHNFKLSNGS